MTRKDIVRMFKRFFLVFACCIPVFVGISLLINGRTTDFVLILIFIVIGGGAFFIEEVVRDKRKKLKKENESVSLSINQEKISETSVKPAEIKEKSDKTDSIKPIKNKNSNTDKSINNKKKGR